MTSLTDKLRAVKTVLGAVSENCYHFRRPTGTEPPFIIWSESHEEDSFNADNGKEEQQILGNIDLYTLEDFDSLIDDIQNALAAADIAFRLDSVQYEDETNLIHYSWQFWV